MDDNDDEHDRVTSSPKCDAWYESNAIRSSRAWDLLKHSWNISPAVSREYIPHAPRVRFWDTGRYHYLEPTTITVFCSQVDDCLARRATWKSQADNSFEGLKRFVDGPGLVEFTEPTIVVEDAEVSFAELMRCLERIAECTIPAISIPKRETWSVSSGIGTMGFEFFSRDQAPSGIQYQWSHRIPTAWSSLRRRILELRDYLESCFADSTSKTGGGA